MVLMSTSIEEMLSNDVRSHRSSTSVSGAKAAHVRLSLDNRVGVEQVTVPGYNQDIDNQPLPHKVCLHYGRS